MIITQAIDLEEVLEPTRQAFLRNQPQGDLSAQIEVWVATYLEHAILTVHRDAIDAELADRVTGEILVVDQPPRAPRPSLPVLAGPPATIGGTP